MDSSGSQEPPGEADEASGCKSGRSSPLPSQEAAELDWTAASSSHLEQVEFVEETPHEYGRASFANFEPATPFSPQQSTSMDYEHRVSPLDPNMSSAARYSPVYSMSNSLVVPNSPSHALAISNPSSPFPSSVGIQNPSSPISSTNNTVMPGSPIDYTGNQVVRQRLIMNQQRVGPTPGPSYSAAALRNPDSPIAGPSGLLRQAFFHADRLTPSPTPQSPLQAPMTPSDNFVSSSTGPADDTNPTMMAESSNLRYLAQTSDSNGILDAKVDSTREVATPLHDSHEMDSSSPPGSYGHEATPVDGREEEESIGKSPDSQHVEVLIGYETIRIVEPDARFITTAAESYLANASNEDSLDPLVAALKASRHGLVFSTEGLTRAELLGLKGRGPLLLEAEGSSGSSSGLPLLLDPNMASLKAEELVLEEMPDLGGAGPSGLEEGVVLETLKTRNLDDQDLEHLAQCPQDVQESMDTDGNLNRPLASPGFCDDQQMEDLGDESLSQQLATHGVVLLPERQELEEEHVTKLEQMEDSPQFEDAHSPLNNGLLRRSKRHTRNSQSEDNENEIWCDDCYQGYTGECPLHKVQSISDKPVPARAWASLPAAYLAISKLPKSAGMGVFARKTIPKRTQFGPLEGLIIKQEEFSVVEQDETRLDLTIELENGEFVVLDTSSENHSNWMRFVRPARCHAEMNLVISQQNGALFYTSTRVILPKQELQVGYSVPYATKRHLMVLQPGQENEEDTENAWPCFECNQLFSSSEGLQKHLNDHDIERDVEEESSKIKSKKTNRTIKRKVLSHLPIKKYKSSDENNQSDGEDGDYHCGVCSRSFPRSYSLKRHLLQHSGEKKHPCGVCGQQFAHPYNRDRHQKKNHKKVENGENTGRFAAIFKQKNSGEEGAWLCSHCHLSFDTASMLNLHTLAHAAEDLEEQDEEDALDALLDPMAVDLQQCPQCSQQYSSKRELVEHTSAHGKALLRRFRGSINPAKPYKCDLCYKSFATDDRLQRHMLVHGTEESKPLQCETCFKRFLNNSALACHIKVHTEEKKTFECPICRALFEQVMALKDHVHVHATDGMFTCPHCAKVFYGYSLIRKHIRAFHSERKHTCSSCGKLFPTLDKLRMHMLRHSDHREFLCANCGKQFKRKDKLKEHMKRMHSAEREAKLAQKPHRQSSTKKFIPKVSPTDYQRFIYKCHSCLLGFKRRGMLVNHLAKRHPDISPESVPELNLPILKTTRDYYCQYCDKVYKSSSKRKAHILKNHPGLELPMSNRRKGGVPEIPGVPNPTFSQTVGSITTHPHGCPWCHKQYASKAKLLQHQRKKHSDLLPHPQMLGEMPRTQRSGCSDSSSEGDNIKFSSGKYLLTPDGDHVDVILHSDGILTSQVNIIPGGGVEYQIATEQELQELQDSGIIIDASALKRPIKGCGEGTDMLSQAMSEITQSLAEFRDGGEGQDHYMKILHTGHIMVTQTSSSQVMDDGSPLGTIDSSEQQLEDEGGSPEDQDTVTVTTAQIESSQLRQLLTNSYSLPPSPPPSTGSQQQSLAILPRGWAATFTSYTAR